MTNLSKERKRAEGESASVPVKSELSRQLCEICGVEPKLDGSNFALSGQPVYPDFEQPENFVKLIESGPFKSIIVMLSSGFLVPFANRKEGLKNLISFLEDKKDKKNIEKLKQTIKETEWCMGDINYPLLKEMIDCVSREVSLRFAVYPKRIQSGKMTKEQADKEIKLMQMIKNALKKVYDGQAPETVQQVFFDLKEFDNKPKEYWR